MAVVESRIVRVFALALSLSCLTIRPALGQGLLGAGAAYLGVGASGISTGKLDDRLAANGYPTFGSSATGVNVGAHVILPGGITVGAEWHGLIIGDAVFNNREVGIGGGYGTLGIGFVKQLSPRLRVFPRLGLGGGGMGLWFDEGSGEVDFDDVLADPQPSEYVNEPVLNTSSAVIDLGLGGEVLPGGFGKGLMLGVRLGYLAAFDTEWSLRNQTVAAGPEANIGGPYIRATIGIGWRR